MALTSTRSAQRRSAGIDYESLPALAACLIIVATVLFNPVLAIVNGNVTPLTDKVVIASEVFLFAAALSVALYRYQTAMLPWIAMMCIAIAFAVLRTAGTGSFEPKYLRDVMLIPTFIMLGMTVRPDQLTRPIVIITVVVLAGMFLEGLALDAYRELFKVQEYYISTRGVDPDSFWDTEVGLYPSAVREDRMLAFVNLHRLSSVFLEPVSLGNFCAVLFAYLLAWGSRLRTATYVFLMLSVVALLIGCDGRLAIVGMILIAAVSAVAPYLPKHSAALYLPAAIIAVCVVTWTAEFSPAGNDFSNRLAHTVWLLESYGPMEYLGISDRFADKAVDSGIAFWIATQSALGVAILWGFITLLVRQQTPAQMRYLHAIALYLSVTMLVSASFASIKTAALMWFILGALQNDPGRIAAAPRTARFR